ncbi:glycosyltransferase family 2 protein [Silvibacterium acidisoli]|uniref:glycosyltransferase family 2 protein n=1 Tax=Acidobacteriaceae bacterium ZG23-2 TaxID=2883246 RepID=UPI00406CA340
MKSFAKQLVNSAIPPGWKWSLQRSRVRRSLTHLHGPRSVRLKKDQAVVTCVVRNGAYFIDAFIRHYQAMGVEHIFFLDNGSSDQTVPIAMSYENTSVSRSTLPVSSNQRYFKMYLAEQSGPGGWCLDADIDELFDYPFSSSIDLRGFLSYLNANQYTAVFAQMLDMFADAPPTGSAGRQRDLKRLYPFYDISGVTRTDYATSEITREHGAGNTLDSPGAELFWGGIRRTLYGSNCLLTKHPLFFPQAVTLFPHVHMVNDARLADVSAILLHYKLTENAIEVAMQNRDQFIHNSGSYGAFVDVLRRPQGFTVQTQTAQRFTDVAALEKDRFVLLSERYKRYASSLEQGGDRGCIPIAAEAAGRMQ